MKRCSHEDCRREHHAKGLCRYHYLEYRAAYARQWRVENPEKTIATRRRATMKQRYGLSLCDYARLRINQSDSCAMCAESIRTKIPSRVHVDHDHTSGRVRGLLCHRCNVALGFFEDETLAANAAAYLARSFDG